MTRNPFERAYDPVAWFSVGAAAMWLLEKLIVV